MKKTVIAIGLMLASSVALAQQAQQVQPRFYVGASVGEARVNLDNVGSNVDESDTAFKIFGGYQFNKWFALEGGYADFGEVVTATAPGGSASIESSALFFDAVGHLPASDSFSVFGKAGIAYTRTDANASGSLIGSYSADKNEVNPKLGAGVQWNATLNLSFRAEYEVYFNVGDDNTTGEKNVNMFTAGAMFRF